jgi:hypothetical protein
MVDVRIDRWLDGRLLPDDRAVVADLVVVSLAPSSCLKRLVAALYLTRCSGAGILALALTSDRSPVVLVT